MDFGQMAPHGSANFHKYDKPHPVMQYLIARFQARFYRLLKQAAPRTVLEVGCGEGFLLNHIAAQDHALALYGVDISLEAVEYASQHCPSFISFAVASGYELPFPSAAFDLVVCSEVLEHLYNVERAALELQRVARRHVLLSVPWEPYFRLFTALAVRAGLGPEPGHVQFWSGRAFQEFVTGLFPRVVDVQRSFPYQIALCELR